MIIVWIFFVLAYACIVCCSLVEQCTVSNKTKQYSRLRAVLIIFCVFWVHGTNSVGSMGKHHSIGTCYTTISREHDLYSNILANDTNNLKLGWPPHNKIPIAIYCQNPELKNVNPEPKITIQCSQTYISNPKP